MNEKLKKLAINIQKECEKDGEPVTFDEAIEMAEMELKAKSNGRHYETDKTKTREKKPREKKIDEEKLKLIDLIQYSLHHLKEIDSNLPFEVTNISIVNNQKEISFNVGTNNYSLSLTKHRPPKSK